MVLNGNTSQDTTSGKNIFNYTRTEKTITKNGVTSTINDDGSITLDGTATALTWFVLNSAFNWESGDYTMYLTDKKIDSFILFSDVGGTDTIKQINVATTITKNISLRIEPNTSFNNLTFFPMILKGKYTLENIGDYEPYTGGQPSPSPDYPQEVKVVKGENVVSVQGKNLFDTSNARNDKTWLTRNSDGSLTLNYPSGSNVNFTDLFENNINMPTDNYILKIFMEGTFVGDNLIVKNTNGNYIGQTPIRNGNTITITNSDIGNIQFYVVSAGTNCTIKLELEKGTPTSYVPYSKTDYPINLGDIELCKINTYKDYFHKDNGKWYVHKEIGKVVLDGSEQMNFQASASTPTERTTFRWYLPTYAQTDNYLSNKFIKGSSTSNRIVIVNGSDRPYISIDNLLAGINVEDDNDTKLAKFKSWLSNNNVTLYYVLVTPTETEITNTTLIEQLEAISKAKSVKDKTYITQTNDELPFILDVEAIKEYEVN